MAINGINYITIAVDASCSQNSDEYERTGFAYYIRLDGATIKHAWYEEKRMFSSSAEVHALMQALDKIEDEIDENTKVIVYADNMTVIHLINKNLTKSKDRWKKKSDKIHSILDKAMEVEARHVPAHTGKTDLKRYYLNKWCDVNARAMKRHKRYWEPRRKK